MSLLAVTLKRNWRCCVFAAILCLLELATTRVDAWSTNQKAFRLHLSGGRQPMTMYMPSTSPTSQPPSFVAQKMLTNPGGGHLRKSEPLRNKNAMKLSNSVLASCDTLPSFSTAHGLLSPETVVRLEELTASGHRSDALESFLDTYRRQGPLSCLPMLSDPDVLPHLTTAMRDIAL